MPVPILSKSYQILTHLFASLKRNKLIANASIYVIGTMLQKALSFLLIPLYTRYLSPADYGIVGLASSVSGMLGMLVGLGVYGAIARYYYEYRDAPDRLKSYLTSNYIFLIVFVVAVSWTLDRTGEAVWLTFTSGQVAFDPYVRLMIWSTCINVLIQIPIILYQTAQRPIAFVLANLGIFLTSIVTIVYFVVYRRMGAEGQMLGDITANGLAAVVLIALMMKEQFSPHINWHYIQVSLKYSLPLIPHMLAGWAMNAVDRILLESGVSLDELGIYNLAYQLGMVMSVLVYSVNQAWMPYYFGMMKREMNPEKSIRKILTVYVIGLGGICLFGSLFSPEIVKWIAPQRYLGAEQFVPPILFAYLLQGFYFFASAPLFYYKKTRLIPIVTLLGASLNILLNVWWIPFWGAMGSAWATTLSFGLLFVAAFILGRRYQKIDLPYGRLAILVSLIAVGVVLSAFTVDLVGSTLNLVSYIKIGLMVLYAILSVWWFAAFRIARFARKSIGFDTKL